MSIRKENSARKAPMNRKVGDWELNDKKMPLMPASCLESLLSVSYNENPLVSLVLALRVWGLLSVK